MPIARRHVGDVPADRQPRNTSRTMMLGGVLMVAAVLATVMVTLRESDASARRFVLLDADDQAFFDSSESVANDGDKNMRKAGEEMKSGELEEALSFAKRAASEYGQSLSEDRLDAAEKVQKQIKAAIAAKKVANNAMIEGVLAEAKKVRADAEASAAKENSNLKHAVAAPAKSQKLTAVPAAHAEAPAQTEPGFRLATQAHLLYKDEKLLNVKAKSQLDSLVKAAKAKLAALKKQFLDQTQPDPADDPTEPVPKVLDCGPLSNDCNTNQGGEFYAQQKPQVKKAPRPSTSAAAATKPVASAEKAAAKGRMAQLALLKRVSKEHAVERRKELDQHGSYSGAMQLLRDLSTGFLVPRAHASAHSSAPRVSQALHEEAAAAGQCAACFTAAWQPLSSLACAEQRCAARSAGSVSLAQAAEDKAVAARLETAMARLDREQLELNNQRATLFAQYVGEMPAAQHTRVQVHKYLRAWVPEGGEEVGTWLQARAGGVTGAEGDSEVQLAVDVREDGAGKEGMTLEQALDPLNEQQKTINDERQKLVHAFVKGGDRHAFGDRKQYLRAEPAVLSWGGHADEQKAAPTPSKVHPKQEKAEAKMAKPQAKPQAKSQAKPQATHGAQPVAQPHAGKQTGGSKQAEAAKQQSTTQEARGKRASQRPAEALPAWLQQGVPADSKAAASAAPHPAAPTPTQSAKPTPAAASQTQSAAEGRAGVSAQSKPRAARGGAAEAASTHLATKGAEATPQSQKHVHPQAAAEKNGAAPGHHGMPQYDAKAAVADMSTWFDGLIHKQIAVGHGVQLHPWDVKPAPAPEVSKKERMREAEDSMIQSHDVAAKEGSTLEQAEEQARKGHLVGKIGNELQHKSDTEARDELQNYFNNLGSS